MSYGIGVFFKKNAKKKEEEAYTKIYMFAFKNNKKIETNISMCKRRALYIFIYFCVSKLFFCCCNIFIL